MEQSPASVKVVKRAGRGLVLRWQDPESGRWRERAAASHLRREAEREAERLATQLSDGVVDSGEITWDKFRQRYEKEHLPSLAPRSASAWGTAAKWIERTVNPACLGDINGSMLSRFAAALRDRELAEPSIASYLRQIKAALNWAVTIGLLAKCPPVVMPPRARGASKDMRSRPVTGEEFDRILETVPKIRPNDSGRWLKFLQGLWTGGLRISEQLDLSWDPGSPLWIEARPKSLPMIAIRTAGEKAHTDRYQPITPEFWALVKDDQRSGLVFPMLYRGKQMTDSHVGRVISEIGEKAKVVTDPTSDKFASSHDIGKRALATRLGGILKQAELAVWMRHQDPKTTMKFYHYLDAQDLARRVWEPKGDISGDTGQDRDASGKPA